MVRLIERVMHALPDDAGYEFASTCASKQIVTVLEVFLIRMHLDSARQVDRSSVEPFKPCSSVGPSWIDVRVGCAPLGGGAVATRDLVTKNDQE